jgi:hypothetical protein
MEIEWKYNGNRMENNESKEKGRGEGQREN